MFIADDILFFPVKSILTIFREIYNAAVQDQADEAESLRAELGRLYLMLESGALDDMAFDAREQEVLDRLDAIESMGIGIGSDEGEDEDEEDEDEDDEDDEDEDEEDEDEDEDEVNANSAIDENDDLVRDDAGPDGQPRRSASGGRGRHPASTANPRGRIQKNEHSYQRSKQ